MSQQDMDQDWEISITVPLSLPKEQRQRLLDAVEQTVDEWTPEDRNWDPMVAAHPETFSLLLWLYAESEWKRGQVEASRRDWAAEAARLQHELEELTATFHQRAAERAEAGGDGPQCDGDCDNGDCHMTSAVAAWQMAAATVQRRLAQADDANGWSLPLCAVHPEVEQ